MTVTITALGKSAGAEVTGVNLATPLADSERQLLREALVKHVALVFREQKLNQALYVDAVRNFGEPVPQNFIDDRLDHPCVSMVSNTIQGKDGKLEKFAGMTPQDSHRLVAEIMAEIEQPKYIYRHQWRDADLLIWDDRASMHQAFSDYDLEETRTFYRIVAEPQRPF